MAELPPRIHLVGVGGAGMSALAKLLAGWGHEVSGSDLRASETLARLAELGLEVWEGHRPEEAAAAELVVASSAVPEGDPELAAARAAGRQVWRRPELLGAITSAVETLGATGTHGKTSTTAMVVVAARAGGLDPSFVVGGELVELATGAAVGRDSLLVLEADEAFGTFEHLHLDGLVVTTVEAEHLDHFGSEEALEAAFTRVARGVTGPVLACLDDPGAARLADRAGAITYGVRHGSRWRIEDVTLGAASSSFVLRAPGVEVPVALGRPGIHMVRNAAGALALLGEWGVDPERAAGGLADFQGVRRRYEIRGTVDGVTVVDDYAHHPTEVAATLRAARRSAEGRLWAVFQPHLYSRTERFQREFGAALALADRVVVTDVYGARETPRPGITGQLVADAAVRAGAAEVDYVPHRAELAAFLGRRVEAGDTVVTMGAGDITVVPTELLALLGRGGPQ